MFRKMPIILICLIAAILCFNSYLSLEAKEILYALSLSIKSVIIFLLPFIIFALLYKTAVSLANQATAIILGILLCVCFSNFLSTFLSYYLGSWVYQFNLSFILPKNTEPLSAAWTFQLPKLISNSWALFSSVVLGIALGILQPRFAKFSANQLEMLASKILKGFVLVIPIFVAGFVVKLQYDGVIQVILKDFLKIFVIIAAVQFTYILFLYMLFNRFHLNRTFASIKNMLPAVIAGFSTMSSAAAMPLTILGAESNAKNKDLARAVIPTTVNIHLIGDCFAIPIFAFAIMKSFGIAEPGLTSYLVFVLYFVLAKFSVAAVPGGGILVMLPILEKYLGFNAEMLSLITAVYILFDPILTCANVLGNGAFSKGIDQLMRLKAKWNSKLAVITTAS